MDLSEAMKFVLKNKSKIILNDFKTHDLKRISQDAFSLLTESKVTTPKETLKEMRSLLVGLIHILNGFPGRVKKGFTILKNDFLNALDELDDQKQKTFFCLRFVGALSRMSLGSIYNMKNIKFGMKTKYSFLQIMLIGICLEALKAILSRFLDEVEKLLTNTEEIKNIHFLKKMIWSTSSSELDQDLPWAHLGPGDRAFQIVESFKDFILNGQRV